MYCIKCGNQLEDNVNFCPACGMKQDAPVGNSKSVKVRIPTKVWIVATVAVILVCLSIVLINVIGGPKMYNSSDKLAIAATEAFLGADVEKLVGCLPDFVVVDVSKQYGLTGETSVKELRKKLVQAMTYENAQPVSIEIQRCWEDDKVSVLDINWIDYGASMSEINEIQDVRYMNVDYSMKATGEEVINGTFQVACVKMNNNWYAFDFD